MAAAHLAACCWPASKMTECMDALLRRKGLTQAAPDVSACSGEDVAAFIAWYAKRVGCEAETLETTFADLGNRLQTAHPAILQLGDAGFLAILHGGRHTLRILTPNLKIKRIALEHVGHALLAAEEQPGRPDYERLLHDSKLSAGKRAKVVDLLIAEQIGAKRFNRCWRLRVSPGARAATWLQQAKAWQNASGLVAAHSVQYLLLLASWAVLGRLSFQGRSDRSWLLVWAFLLLTLIPFRVLSTWIQGRLVVSIGASLKRRLLYGALRLSPDEIRHEGVGSFLGQALEAEAVETLALSGGIAGLLAVVELVISGFLLGRFALLLFFWTLLTAALAARFLHGYRGWTRSRMRVTEDLIESMVGHRTRLAQQRREDRHAAEDQALQSYFAGSRAMDGSAASLVAFIPRGWLLAGLVCLAPSIVKGSLSEARIGLFLGGLLLAFTAFRRLTASFAEVAAAAVAWQRIAPLFHSAARPENLPAIAGKRQQVSQNVIEANHLAFSYRQGGPAVLKSGNLIIRRGERVLLAGASGGGKSTLAGLLAGLRDPDAGLLLLNGLDRHTLGDDQWRKQVVAAPQFHENHILTETLAFNLLMGRNWPPTQSDMTEAEDLCRELGLGDLLERMPAGMMQMVGEGGWQLSHGERSRVYVARAILQKADLVILDESFGALDPENLKVALECTLRHAETLLVIAHP